MNTGNYQRAEKEVPGHQDHVYLGQGDQCLPLALDLTQTRPGLCEGLGGAGALGGDARALLAVGSMVLASLRGLVLPWLATLGDFGELTPHACSEHIPWPQAMGCVPGCTEDDRRGESDERRDAPLKRAR
jgi:hypothetical protein